MKTIRNSIFSLVLSPVLFCLAALLAATTIVHAQELSEIQDPTKTRIARAFEWEFLRAETELKLAENESSKSRFLYALEEYTSAVCMPNYFEHYHFAGLPQEPKCLELLKQLKELDPENPQYHCVTQGYDSPKCEQAYLSQVVGNYEEVNLSRPDTGSRLTYVDSNKIQPLEAEYTEKPSDSAYRSIIGFYHPHLKNLCQPVSTRTVTRKEFNRSGLAARLSQETGPRVDPEIEMLLNPILNSIPVAPEDPGGLSSLQGSTAGTAPVERAEASQSDPKELSPTAKLLQELEKREKGNPQKQSLRSDTGTIRIRIVPSHCKGLVERLLQIVPTSSLAICFRDGVFSTHCARAREQENKYLETLQRKQKGPEPPAFKKGGPGMEEF